MNEERYSASSLCSVGYWFSIPSGTESSRWSGTNTSSATSVFDPVPFMPATYHVSSTASSDIGMSASTCSVTLPAASLSSAPTRPQVACNEPEAHGQRPLITRPPSSRRSRSTG